MTKKVLMLAAKANMIQQFNHHNIKILQKIGYEVHVATNMVDFGSMSISENERFKEWMVQNSVLAHQVDFGRGMGTFKGNIQAVKQLKKLLNEHKFSFIHVHSPLGSILGRLIARGFKIPTIYTAHGFHFFKGGPITSWLVFFPLEWFFSFITDILITINDEDFVLAKKYMHAKKTFKINGVGVDIAKTWDVSDSEKEELRRKIRKDLNIPHDAYVISSVGELSDRKNHLIVLEALQRMDAEKRKNIYYIIAGTGPNREALQKKANSFNFDSNFKLLGYRNDIHSINYASDLSVFPSLREGLGLAGLDAIIDGVFVIGTNKGGVSDYILDTVNGYLFNPIDSKELNRLILHCLKQNKKVPKMDYLAKFDVNKINETMEKVYQELNHE